MTDCRRRIFPKVSIPVWGSKIKGPLGLVIEVVDNIKTTAEAVSEIYEYIDKNGTESVWTIDIGTITFETTRESSWGFRMVRE